jgi:hypothetical protein
MTTAGSGITPARYRPYERRFESYATAQGYACQRADDWHRTGQREREAMMHRYDRESMDTRTAPDRLVTDSNGQRVYVEVKAHDRPNVALEVVQLLSNVRRSQQAGVPVLYVLVPPTGAMRARSASAIVASRRTVRATRDHPSNQRAEELLRLLDLDWSWWYGESKAGFADPYVVVLEQEVREWQVLVDSATIAAIKSNRPNAGTSDRSSAR